MAKLTLTSFERAVLANQMRILSQLDPVYAKHYQLEQKIEVLDLGLEGEYSTVLSGFGENAVPPEVTTFANDVLVMMSNILEFRSELTDYDLSEIRQVQFDARDEDGYLSSAKHLLKYHSYQDVESVANSHHATIARYESMFEPYREALESGNWGLTAARATLDAGGYRKKTGDK